MQKIINPLFMIAIILVASALLYLLAPVLTPFLISALLAYLAAPLVGKLKQLHVPNLVSIVFVFFLVFLTIFLLFLLFIPLIEKQVMILIKLFPVMFTWVQDRAVPWVDTHFNMNVNDTFNINTIKSTLAVAIPKMGGAATWLLSGGHALILWLTNIILIPVVTFYLLRDWSPLKKGLRSLLPRSIEPTMVKLLKESDEVLSAFFRGQLLVMLSLAVIYSIGLNLIGLQIGLMIGLVAGVASVVPYLGFIVGMIAASVAALMQFGTWHILPWVLLVFAVGQCVESFILTPHFIGHRIGLHPVAVIFAILAGGMLFGFFGVLLALPVAAVVMVWMRFLTQHYRQSRFYK